MAYGTREYSNDILGAIDGIEKCLVGYDFEKFRTGYATNDSGPAAVERYLERLCEASRRLPDDVRETEKDIPWHSIFALGNILRHEYRHVKANLIWEICTKDLPVLKLAMERIKSRL